MIDHVSVGVRDLARSSALYDALLATLGHRRLTTLANTVGYGKTYPEFWLNARPNLAPQDDTGTHVCLRARSVEVVQAFHRVALAHGARDRGAPGPRPEYHERYYAAFVQDADGNVIEAVTFLPA